MIAKRTLLIDSAIALGMGAAMFGEVAINPQLGIGSIVMTAIMAATLAFRRIFPLAAHIANGIALVVQASFFFVGGIYTYSNLVSTFSVATHATKGRAIVGLAAAMVTVAGYFLNADASFQALPALPAIVAFLWSIAWGSGYSATRRRELHEEVQAREAAQAVLEERNRIARELHDLIGHTVNVMLVQAGAARRLVDSDPDRARSSLEALEEVGRSALGELDWMLGMLRTDVDDPQPQPGLEQLSDLVDRFERSGLQVSCEVTGVRPSGNVRPVELSAYRIVQEALTNTLKHADANEAKVRIEYTNDGIDIEVVDNGRGGPGAIPGRGLLGIGERAAVFDGHVEHGPVPGGGFRVHAFLAAT